MQGPPSFRPGHRSHPSISAVPNSLNWTSPCTLRAARSSRHCASKLPPKSCKARLPSGRATARTHPSQLQHYPFRPCPPQQPQLDLALHTASCPQQPPLRIGIAHKQPDSTRAKADRSSSASCPRKWRCWHSFSHVVVSNGLGSCESTCGGERLFHCLSGAGLRMNAGERAERGVTGQRQARQNGRRRQLARAVTLTPKDSPGGSRPLP